MSPSTPHTMRRARISGPERISIEKVDLAPVGPREVRLRVDSCGICGSDVSMFRGNHPVIRPPLTPGHEVVGTVIETGDDVMEHESALGAIVVLVPQVGCGHCAMCARGTERICEQMRLIGGQIDGGLAEYLTVPVGNVLDVPRSVPTELRPLIEPLSVAAHAVRLGSPREGERCLVIGAGPIGTLVALAARECGADVIVVDRLEERRDVARRLGLDAREHPGRDYDLVLECVGGAQTPRLALELSRPGGRVVLVGVAASELTLDGIALQRQERMIVGSHMYDRCDIETSFDLLASGVLPEDPGHLSLLIEEYPLDGAQEALSKLAEGRPGALKVVIRP